MGPLEIIALLKAGVSTVQTAYDAYQKIKHTMSEQDQQTIENELEAAKTATAAMRPAVDAALDEAAKN